MTIAEIIQKLKEYHRGYGEIDEAVTRDKILFGNPDQECTGILTTCWASMEAIRKAVELGCNLIVCHEALFWNHGDHTDWLEESKNSTYLEKKELLQSHNIVVWRDHDYIHSGIPMNGSWTDGIFYGLAKELGWTDDLAQGPENTFVYEYKQDKTAGSIAKEMKEKLNLNGLKLIGNPDLPIKKARIIFHVLGDVNDTIQQLDTDGTDLLICMELVDYTMMEYVRDSAQQGKNKAIVCAGHFNTEEPGMKYCLEYFPDVIGKDIPVYYFQSGDNYQYI